MDESRLWDGFAGRYDRLVRLFDRSYPAIRTMLREDLAGCAKVLEIAAGTGQFTAALAEVAESLLATDVSPKMVEGLRAAVERRGGTNVDVAVMSAYEIEAEDAAFDGVFCANALHVMETPVRALTELRRVLRPDGRLVAPTFLHGASLGPRILSSTLSLVSSFVAHRRLDLAGLTGLVEDAGFVIERSEQLPGLFPTGYVSARPR